MIQNSTDSMSLDKSLAELNARLSTLELANKNVYKNYANQVNKPLKAELNKRTAPFLSSTETPPSPILVQQILFLQNLNDSLLVSANALRTEANSKKEPVQKNQLLRNAFDDEMKAQKVMQHMIMAMDSKGVFDLYNPQEITFLRSSTDEQIRSEFKSKKTYLATTDAIIGEPYYVKSSNTEKNIPVEKDFFYTVQIGAFKNTFYIEQWDEWQTIIGEKIENGLTRVMIGKEQTSEQAETSKKRLQDLGYADAFVVLYNNGERLPIREIIEIAENTDTTLYEKANKKAEKMKSWNRGMYLWSKSFLNHSTDEIIRDLKDWKIDHVILSPTTDPKNWEKAQPLITQLDQNEIGVEWMIGNNKWLGTPITSKLDSLKSQIDQWQIKTLHLDIEPHTLPDYKKQKDIYHQQYIQLIREASAFCKKHEMTLNASIPLGLPEDVLQTICDLGVSLTLMAYENPNIEAIQRRSQEEVKTGKENVIMALRAKDYKKSSELEKDLQILKDWVPSHITVIHDYNTYKQISSNEKR
jgi:hypothetical protein